jgi:hypothetical protein
MMHRPLQKERGRDEDIMRLCPFLGLLVIRTIRKIFHSTPAAGSGSPRSRLSTSAPEDASSMCLVPVLSIVYTARPFCAGPWTSLSLTTKLCQVYFLLPLDGFDYERNSI